MRNFFKFIAYAYFSRIQKNNPFMGSFITTTILALFVSCVVSVGAVIFYIPDSSDLVCRNGRIESVEKGERGSIFNKYAVIKGQGYEDKFNISMVGNFFEGSQGKDIGFCFSDSAFIAGVPFTFLNKVLSVRIDGVGFEYEKSKSIMKSNAIRSRKIFSVSLFFLVIIAAFFGLAARSDFQEMNK